MRIAFDYTPAITQRAGVGRYTRSLVAALARYLDENERLTLWTSGRHASSEVIEAVGPAHGQVIRRELPISDRWLTMAWQRLHLPIRLERLVGEADVVHGPDFVVPPSGAPSIATIHDLSYLITPQFAFPNLRRYLSHAVPRTLARAHHVVAVSQATGTDLVEHYDVDPARITVIPNGVDPIFRPPTPDAAEQVIKSFGISQPYYLTVGTVEPRKNHQTLLRAFRHVHRARPDVTLVIVGRPGWLSSSIMHTIGRLSEHLPIHHLLTVDDVALRALYSQSVALVYPSWYEGFGLPIVEAMACGTAVITSHHGATAEIGGEGAILVPPDDVDAIAGAMCQLADDSSWRNNLIRRGRERAACFSWDSAADAYLRLYQEVAVDAKQRRGHHVD